MKNEKETTASAKAQGSGRKTNMTTPEAAAATSTPSAANMNPEAEGLQGWANTEGRTSANRSIGDRLSRQYNSLSQTQKIVGASLLGAAAVGTAYLTRGMWGKKNTWTAQAREKQSRKNQNPANSYASAERHSQSSQSESSRRATENRSGASEMTM